MSATSKIQRVVEYIDAHLTDEITIAALAEMAGYSPWHLYHVFLNCTGTPIMEFIRLRRLERAVDELAQGRRLLDIALDYGFATQAGFYKAFKRHLGCSPSRYRIHQLREVHRQIDPVLLDVVEKGEHLQDRVVIRIIQERDAEDLWENVWSRNTLNEVKQRIANDRKAMAAEEAVSLVAEVDGHVIGAAYLKFNDPPGVDACGFYGLVVHPGFQRMGIARRFFNECKARAVEKGIALMKCRVRGGTTWEIVMRKFGFIECGRIPNAITQCWGEQRVYDAVDFYLPLTARTSYRSSEKRRRNA